MKRERRRRKQRGIRLDNEKNLRLIYQVCVTQLDASLLERGLAATPGSVHSILFAVSFFFLFLSFFLRVNLHLSFFYFVYPYMLRL